MGKRFKHDWRGIIFDNGSSIRYLLSDEHYASVSPPPVQPLEYGEQVYTRKISLWQRFTTAIGIWWERLFIKLRRA